MHLLLHNGRNKFGFGKEMPIIAGIEEAGRGPVIGPMVMAIAVINAQKISYLSEIGVKDSKKLSPKRRDSLFDQLKEILDAYKYIIISPQEIDAALESENSNLNWLEAEKSIELYNLIIKEIHIDQLILDCPSTNIESYRAYLEKRMHIDPQCLIAEHKADENYPIVSAASITAKVIRDREIQKLQKKYKIDFGSGYSSDPRTQNFLREWMKNHNKLPEFVRKSWITARNILNEAKQRKLDDFKE